MFPNKIKCVIWDLDDTLWSGTLAEREAVQPRAEITALIPRLDAKGIVNSICSKNEEEDALRELDRLRLRAYFVFPAIRFAPKGASVKAIVESLQLRAANVLFVDDNPANRNEVAYYNPDIMVADANDESFLAQMRELIDTTHGHSRLEQYRVLEQKHGARQRYPSNEAFLRESGVTACLLRNPADLTYKDRIVELVNRSNQLNFTKSRFPTDAQFQAYAERADIVHGCVFAYDRYGDYGLVGFFAFNESTRKRALEHFVFSCRIMNMGIEQAVYADLRRRFSLRPLPPLEAHATDPSFVTLIHELDAHLRDYVRKSMDAPERYRTSIIAGCTAGVIDHYLPAALRPARHDLYHLEDSGRTIDGVDTIVYAVYGDYGSDAWEHLAFSYPRFRSHLAAFLDANAHGRVVLMLASERPIPHGKRADAIAKVRGGLSDVYRGKTRRRMIRCNAIVRELCAGRPDVCLMNSGDYVLDPREQIDPRHFERIVIQRMCEAIPGANPDREPHARAPAAAEAFARPGAAGPARERTSP